MMYMTFEAHPDDGVNSFSNVDLRDVISASCVSSHEAIVWNTES